MYMYSKESMKLNTNSNTKGTNKISKSTIERPLPRAPPPGNFNINYNTFEVKIPNYTFGRAIELAGAGGLIAVCIGKRNSDNKVVLAKLSPHYVRLEREYYVSKKLYVLPEGPEYIPNAIEYISLVQDGLAALLYTDIQPNDCIYFEYQQKPSYHSLYYLSELSNNNDIWSEQFDHVPDCNNVSLSKFLNLAVNCSSALQFLHENGIIHGELRPSAFICRHDPVQDIIYTKLWNFGDGLNSYEELLLTSSRWRSFMSNDNAITNSPLIPTPPPPPPLISIPSGYLETTRKNLKTSRFYSPKEFSSSLVYVSPEQTGRTSNALDHRADLYSLGIMFFVLLTYQNPFNGTAMDVIHAILSKNVPLVHTIRRDVPPVISLIIDKLTRKTVDERYDSAYGLREDLLECQKRLESDNSDEELNYFQLGLRDVNPVFRVSDSIYGRKKELELLSTIIEDTYNTHHTEMNKAKTKESSDQVIDGTVKENIIKEADNLLRVNTATSLDNTHCQVIVLKGPGGIGKSTLVSTLSVQARHCGYTATAKFDKNQKRPYNGLLRCLSLILRQLLTESEHCIREFYSDLKHNLGPQFSNVRLMVSMVPELKPILYDYREQLAPPSDDSHSNILNTETRFHSVYLNIIRTIARKKLVTLCLDDLQEADEASIHLISALIYSKTTMLVILTFRDGDETPKSVIDMLEKCVDPVINIQLRPLGTEIVKDLVLNTLYSNSHSSMSFQEAEQQLHTETIKPLVDIIYSWTRGNPFYTKQFLKTMKRNDDIWFDWNDKHWKFRLDNIKKMFDQQQKKTTEILGDHIFDVRNLVSHLRSLDLNSQYFLMWASLFGHVFNFRRIKWLMMTTPTGGETSDEDSSTASSNSKDISTTQLPALSLEEEEKRSNQAMLGLQTSLNEGIIQYKVGNEFHFIHDRYYQAASMLIVDPFIRERMHLKIGQMLMMEEGLEEDDNVFLIADHFVNSIGLLRFIEKRKCYRDILIRAGDEASSSGALPISDTYYKCALSLLDDDIEKRWEDSADSSFRETFNIYMKVLEFKLINNKSIKSVSAVTNKKYNDFENDDFLSWKSAITNRENRFVQRATIMEVDKERDDLITQIMKYTKNHPYERASAWRTQARIYFQHSQYRKGIQNILEALEELGIVVDTNISEQEVISYFNSMKPKITKPGFDILLKAGPCKDVEHKAIMLLLYEACNGAYWVNPILVDFFALKLCEYSLKYGYTAASGGGFIWAGCTATRVSEFSFAYQLGRFGLALSEKYAGNSEIARSIIVYHAMLAQWTGVHVREYIYQYQRAFKYAIAGGDQLYASVALFHVASTLYWTSCNLSEIHWHLNHSMEECRKGSSKDILILNISLWRSVLVFQGKAGATKDPETIMNDPDSNFDEPSFVEDLKSQSVNTGNPLSWHYSFKMILLIHFGFHNAASELGFKILYDDAVNIFVHRHVGIAIYYHCIAMVECLRDPHIAPDLKEKYENQLRLNESLLNELASHSEVNYRMYHKIVQTQISTLDRKNIEVSLRLYNEVMELALKGNWYSFLGLTYELASEHYMRCGLTMLAVPTLVRSIEFYARWGAYGKVEYLKEKYASILNSQIIVEKESVAVQTDDVIVGLTTTVLDKGLGVWDNNSTEETSSDPSLKELYNNEERQQRVPDNVGINAEVNSVMTDEVELIKEEALFSLDMVDLASIIKSTQVISNEMNSFDELLKKMMGIIMANSGAESGAIIIKEGFFGIASYSERSTDTCQTFEPPLPLRDDDDKIATSIVHYVIHTHTNLFISNVQNDPRFAIGDNGIKKGAVICMPIMHKSTLVGVLYLQAKLNAFTSKHANVLALLCDQIGISITNALLFKSVQKATKANALMIESQLKALEEARASREQALRATKMKSNFLANMSHELRTPFSGFYGMISLLSETRLDVEQREFVSIAKQSCEMLLHIIDDLLDFSKLEAHKVKLIHGLFYIEDLIADRLELLITLATNKNVELTYFIDKDVPAMAFGDGNRIGQILMNLIGNAIKFTHHGEVVVRCGVDKEAVFDEPDSLKLKISVQDTGIGMSEDEIKGLFLPFSQVDGSTTRNFGGTGLGLSICLQLVKLMNGDIHVKSVVNEGSTFTFTIAVKNGSFVDETENACNSICATIRELKPQIGQPHILVISPERIKLMIQSFIPWVENLEHSAHAEDGIQLAITNANSGKAFDFIILDSPEQDALQKVIKSIDETPILKNMRVLLLIAPTINNIQRHSHNSVGNIDNSTKEIEHLYYHYVFHPSVTRLSKPLRTVKLLNALVNVINIRNASLESTSNKTEDLNASIDSIPQIATTTITSYPRKTNGTFSPEELALFKGQKILVAEDNPLAQKLIMKQLERLGFVVEKCNNGFECFETWKARGPGYFVLAWIDHHMPKCDGLEATRLIREFEKNNCYSPALPIIALTADIQYSAQLNCINAGMNDYVTKPLMQKDLASILRKYCLGPSTLQ